MEAIAARVETIAPRVEAIAARVETIAARVEAIAPRVEAIAARVETIAARVETIAPRVEAIAPRVEAIAIRFLKVFFLRVCVSGSGVSDLPSQPIAIGRVAPTFSSVSSPRKSMTFTTCPRKACKALQHNFLLVMPQRDE